MAAEKIPGFAERLKATRENLGLRQEDLGDRLNASRYRVSNWEIDLSYPTLAMFRNLCMATGCSADYLLGLSEMVLDEKEHRCLLKYRALPSHDQDAVEALMDHFAESAPTTEA